MRFVVHRPSMSGLPLGSMILARHVRRRVAPIAVASLAAIVVAYSSVGSVSAQTISSPPPAITIPDCPAFEPDTEPAPTPDPTIAPSSVARDDLPVLRGRWDSAGEIPIAPRTDAAVIVTPFEPFGTLVWGGVGPDGALLGDGAVIDGGTGQARAIPPSPLCPRRDFAASLGIDGQATIWGGVDQAGQPLADGATFSFETGTWTYLPPSDLPGGPAVMAGGLVIVADPATGAPVAALLRSAEAAVRWEGPILIPVAAGERYAIAACCPPDFNEEVTVYSIHADGTADAIRSRNLYSFPRDWVSLGQVPYPEVDRISPTYGHAQERDQLVWFTTADAVVGEDEVPAHTGIAFDAQDTSPPWGLLETAPDGVAGDSSLAMSPTHVISVQGMAAYDLRRDRWLRLPRRDDQPRFGDPDGATAWWQYGRLWVFGGRTPDGSMESLLWTFTPRLPPGTYALPVTRGPIGCEVRPDRRAPRSADWRLTGDPADPMRVWAEWRGLRQQLWWPEGWTVRFRPRLVVQDTTGAVRARGGETCRLTSGSGG